MDVIIIDTPGPDKFDEMSESYYKTADCCLLVYDIIDEDSFKKIKHYIEEIINNCPELIKVFLLGNKTDLEEQRINSVEEVNETHLKKTKRN